MRNTDSMPLDDLDDESWEVKAFAEDSGNTWPPRSYTCTFCRREFRSAQALGGHMNVHRRDRARLHQSQPHFTNPSSSSLINPTQDSLCTLLFALPKPNYVFKPSNVNGGHGHSHGHGHGHGQAIMPNPNTGNLMNFPAVVNPHSPNYHISSSSRNEASTSMDRKSNRRISSHDLKTDFAVDQGVDLELRLGSCSSSSS